MFSLFKKEESEETKSPKYIVEFNNISNNISQIFPPTKPSTLILEEQIGVLSIFATKLGICSYLENQHDGYINMDYKMVSKLKTINRMNETNLELDLQKNLIIKLSSRLGFISYIKHANN